MSVRNSPASSIGLAAIALLTAGVIGCGVQGGTPGNGSAGTTGGAGATSTAGSTGTGTAGATGTAGTTTGTAGSTTGTAGAAGGDTGTAGTTSTGGTTGTAGTGGTTATGGATGMAGAGGTPVLSGITVKIGNVDVPKENVIAFVNFGHSNMAGRGVTPAALRPYFFTTTEPHSWMYHSGAGFAPSLEPKTAGDSGNTVNGMVSGGLSTALVKGAAAMNPNKYFVTVPFGAGKAYCSQFLPGALYYNSAMKGAIELKDKVTWGGIVLLLGITERHGTQADIDNYPQCINKLVTAIRTDLGQPNLPFLLNDYEMGTTGPLAPVASDAFFVAIRPKILMVPSVVSISALIPTDMPIIPIQDDTSTDDDHHFDLAGHQEYARRVLQTMKDKGWAPWLTP